MQQTALPIPLPIPKIPNPLGGGGGLGAGQVIKWIGQGITQAINAFFGDLVKSALNPLLKLLGQTLLTTPDLGTLPRVGQLWENSRQIAVAVYALLILAAAILVMAYETVQTRHGIKEIAPRIVIGFVAANLSLLLAGKAVSFANALSTGLLGQGVNAKAAAGTLTTLVMNAVTNGGIFLTFIGLAMAVILLALLVAYVIRVALTVILIAGAPLALMCYALPQTEGVARWWWRAIAGALAIQLCQSLTLVAALDVFLAPGGFTVFGPTRSGLVDLIVTLALLYILYKIPFWIMAAVQVGGGRRSFVGGLIKGVIAYKTFGMLTRGGAAAPTAGAATRPGPGRGPGGSAPPRTASSPSGPRPPRPSGPSGPGGPTAPRGVGGPGPARPAGDGGAALTAPAASSDVPLIGARLHRLELADSANQPSRLAPLVTAGLNQDDHRPARRSASRDVARMVGDHRSARGPFALQPGAPGRGLPRPRTANSPSAPGLGRRPAPASSPARGAVLPVRPPDLPARQHPAPPRRSRPNRPGGTPR
jgi:hypothetical protein